jgi:hypothetical protein
VIVVIIIMEKVNEFIEKFKESLDIFETKDIDLIYQTIHKLSEKYIFTQKMNKHTTQLRNFMKSIITKLKSAEGEKPTKLEFEELKQITNRLIVNDHKYVIADFHVVASTKIIMDVLVIDVFYNGTDNGFGDLSFDIYFEKGYDSDNDYVTLKEDDIIEGWSFTIDNELLNIYKKMKLFTSFDIFREYLLDLCRSINLCDENFKFRFYL